MSPQAPSWREDIIAGTNAVNAISNAVTIYGNRDGRSEYGEWLSQSIIWAFLRNAHDPRSLARNVYRIEFALYRISNQTERPYLVGDQAMGGHQFRTSSGTLLSKAEEAVLQRELVPQWNANQRKKHNVLLLGATGYIGGAIAKLFHETSSIECYCLVRKPSDVSRLETYANHIIRAPTDVITEGDIKNALRRYSIDCVIDMCWFRSYEDTPAGWKKCCAEHALHHNNIFNAVNAVDSNIFVLSSSGNFSLLTASLRNSTIRVPSDESQMPVIPTDEYAPSQEISDFAHIVKSNVFNDNLVQRRLENGAKACIVYICSVYGVSPSKNQGIWDYMMSAYFADPIEASKANVNAMYTSWIHVEDVAKAYLQIVTNPAARKYNYYLIGNESLSVSAVAQKLGVAKDKLVDLGNHRDIVWDVEPTNEFLGVRYEHSLNDPKDTKEWRRAIQALVPPLKSNL